MAPKKLKQQGKINLKLRKDTKSFESNNNIPDAGHQPEATPNE